MQKLERQETIRTYIEEYGKATVLELCNHCKASEATIRRDLDVLDGSFLTRTRGGAIKVGKASKEPPFNQRLFDQYHEKQKIGKAAASLINDGETVFLTSGSTCLEVAKNIPDDIKLDVITNSLSICNELVNKPNIDLIVIGGYFRKSEYSMIGHIAENAIAELRADKVFISMRAGDIKNGITNDYLPETLTDRMILSIASTVILIADHTKFNKISTAYVAPLSSAHIIVTDTKTPPETIEQIQALGIKTIIV